MNALNVKLEALDVSYSNESTATETDIQFGLLNSTLLSDESIKIFTDCEEEKWISQPIQTGILEERNVTKPSTRTTEHTKSSRCSALNISLASDDSIPVLDNKREATTPPPSSKNDMSEIATNHAQRVVGHMLSFNHTYSSLEPSAQIVNSTPNASIRIPKTKYKLKKTVQAQFSSEYHIKCAQCRDYSVVTAPGRQVKCGSCSTIISTSHSEFFIYIPLKAQLEKMISENVDEVCSYLSFKNLDHHFVSDIHDCIQFEKVSTKYGEHKIISLVACTDGVQLYNKSGKSLWAIQLYLNCLKPERRYKSDQIIVVAFYVGKHKPNMQEFFYPLMKELEQIRDENGILVAKNTLFIRCMPIITSVCCDLPAKADVQGMNGHAGYFACGYCLHPGVAVKKDAKSKSYVRYVDRKKDEQERTHENIVGIYSKLKPSSKHINGIKSISCMIAEENFDMVHGFAIDYMHCFLINVMDKLYDLWLNSSNHKNPYYISPKCQKVLNARILNIKPTSDVFRKPPSIFERAEFKATDFRSFLLYYLRFSLTDLLKGTYIEHFHLLSSACYILLKENISREEIDLADERLTKFSNEFQLLYGASNVTLNVHLIKHIGSSVRQLGPLWAQSAFAMEGNNGIIKKTNSKKNPVHSIAWKYCARVTKKYEKEITTKFCVGQKASITLSPQEFEIMSNFASGTKLEIYKFVLISGKKYTSIKSKEIASVDYFVELTDGKIGQIAFYFVHEFIIYGLLKLYESIEHLDHFRVVKPTGIDTVFVVSNIKKKLIYIKIGNKEITTSAPNRYEKT